MSKRAIVAVVVVVGVAAVVVSRLTGAGRDAVRDAAGIAGLVDDPPFRIRLDGPLWRSRTLRDPDGAKDVALVAGDLPLQVKLSGGDGARIATVELRVDGRRQRLVRPPCGRGGCPKALNLTLVPQLRGLPPGNHHVELIARDPRAGARSSDTGSHVSSRRFSVRTVTRVPAVIEGQTARRQPAPAPSRGDPLLERAALDVLAAERSRPGLATALGTTQLSVIQVGSLTARGRPLGATMWVQLSAARRNVRATVPDYVPASGSTGPAYSGQQVKMRVAVLRDALIDVDLSTGRVIAFEPGPRSRTLKWSPSQAPAPAGGADED